MINLYIYHGGWAQGAESPRFRARCTQAGTDAGSGRLPARTPVPVAPSRHGPPLAPLPAAPCDAALPQPGSRPGTSPAALATPGRRGATEGLRGQSTPRPPPGVVGWRPPDAFANPVHLASWREAFAASDSGKEVTKYGRPRRHLARKERALRWTLPTRRTAAHKFPRQGK